MAHLTPMMLMPGPQGTWCETWPMLERPGHVGYRSYGRYYKPFGGLYSEASNTPVPSFPFASPSPLFMPSRGTQGMPQMTLAFLASRAAQGGGIVEGWEALGRGVYGRLGGHPLPWAAQAAPFRP